MPGIACDSLERPTIYALYLFLSVAPIHHWEQSLSASVFTFGTVYFTIDGPHKNDFLTSLFHQSETNKYEEKKRAHGHVGKRPPQNIVQHIIKHSRDVLIPSVGNEQI